MVNWKFWKNNGDDEKQETPKGKGLALEITYNGSKIFDGRVLFNDNNEIRIGRLEDNEVKLNSFLFVSRYHGKIIFSDDRYFYVDNSSTVGTWIINAKSESEEVGETPKRIYKTNLPYEISAKTQFMIRNHQNEEDEYENEIIIKISSTFVDTGK